MKLELRLALECPVCLNLMDDAERDETAKEAALFGAIRFAICPCCGRKANLKSAGYRVRARRWLGQLEYENTEEEVTK